MDKIKISINPFFHRIHLSVADIVRITVLTPFIILKLIGAFLSGGIGLFIAYCTIWSGCFGEGYFDRPLTKFERFIRWISYRIFLRGIFFFTGFYWVRVKGKRATWAEAPILVAAPHSSYMDILVLAVLGGPSVVSKVDVRYIPIFGRAIEFMQPIFVQRDSGTSRRSTSDKIIQRARMKTEINQIFIFPEGTTSNRNSLLAFKNGSFQPMVPVQPVLIKYPKHKDTFTWTFDGPSFYKTTFLAMTNWGNVLEIEFLPVINPPEGELDPSVFNMLVRREMGKQLNIPLTNYSFPDGNKVANIQKLPLFSRLRPFSAQMKHVPFSLKDISVENLENFLNSVKYVYKINWRNWSISEQTFKEIIVTEADELDVEELFRMFNPKNERIDLREFLITDLILKLPLTRDEMAFVIFQIYSEWAETMNKEKCAYTMNSLFEISEPEVNLIFDKLDDNMTIEKFKVATKLQLEILQLYSLNFQGIITDYPHSTHWWMDVD